MIENQDRNFSCVACGQPLSFFGRRLNYEYHQCVECHTIQLAPMPDAGELADAYKTQYATAGHYEGDPLYSNALAKTFHQCIVQALQDFHVEGVVLDYGAGWGGLTQMIISQGFQCQGLEISEEMATYCRNHGLPVQCGDWAVLPPTEKVSAIVLCTVFEHLVEHDLWLGKAYRALDDQGVLISLHPTAAFASFMGRLLRLGNLRKPLPSVDTIFCPPWHTALFSLDGMKALAGRNGFEVLEVRPSPQSRQGGFKEIVQIGLETVNRVGWHLVGSRWPLMISHVFILRKVRGFD